MTFGPVATMAFLKSFNIVDDGGGADFDTAMIGSKMVYDIVVHLRVGEVPPLLFADEEIAIFTQVTPNYVSE